MSLKEKIHRQLNDSFKDELKKYMKETFDVDIETYYAFLGDMNYHSSRVDGKNFTRKHIDAMKAWETGYMQAMQQVR